MGLDIGTLTAHVGLDTKPLASGAAKANGILNSLGLGMGSIRGAALGLAASVAAGFSVKSIVTFGTTTQEKLRRAAAEMRATRVEAAKLSEAIVGMKVPAKGAQALEQLAIRGMDASEALTALPSVMNFAKAHALEMGQAVDSVTMGLEAFKLPATDAARVTDILSIGASRSRATLGEFVDAMQAAAPTARAMGYSIEETASMVGALADAGIKGSKAGANLSMAMRRAGSIAREFGLANANLVSELEWFNRTGKSSQDILEAFGMRSGVAALALRKALPDAQKYREEMRGAAGETKRLADAMRHGLGTPFAELKGAIQGISIEVFKVFEGDIRKALVDVGKAIRDNRKGIVEFITGIATIGAKLGTIIKFLTRGDAKILTVVAGVIAQIGHNAESARSAFGGFASELERAQAAIDPEKWKALQLAMGPPKKGLDEEWIDSITGPFGETKSQYQDRLGKEWKDDTERRYQELLKLRDESRSVVIPRFQLDHKEQELLGSLGKTGTSVREAKRIWQEYFDSVSKRLYQLQDQINGTPPWKPASGLSDIISGMNLTPTLSGMGNPLVAQIEQWRKDLTEQTPNWAPPAPVPDPAAIKQKLREMTSSTVEAYREMAASGLLSAGQLQEAWEVEKNARLKQIDQERQAYIELGVTKKDRIRRMREANDIAKNQRAQLPAEERDFKANRNLSNQVNAYRQLLSSTAATSEQLTAIWGKYYDGARQLLMKDIEDWGLGMDEKTQLLAKFEADMRGENYNTFGLGSELPRINAEISALRDLLNDPALSKSKRKEIWGWLQGDEGKRIEDFRKQLEDLKVPQPRVDEIIGAEQSKLTRERFEDLHKELLGWARDVGQSMTDAFSTSFFGVMTGEIQKFGDFLRSFYQSLVADLSRITSQALSEWVMGFAQSGFGSFGGGSSKGSGGFVDYTGEGPTFAAAGGVFTQPTLAMIGEAGPEAVIPLGRLRDPDFLDRLAGGGGRSQRGRGGDVNATFVIQTPSPGAFKATQAQILSQAAVALSRVMKE